MELLLAGTTVKVSDPLAVPDMLRPRTQTDGEDGDEKDEM